MLLTKNRKKKGKSHIFFDGEDRNEIIELINETDLSPTENRECRFVKL